MQKQLGPQSLAHAFPNRESGQRHRFDGYALVRGGQLRGKRRNNSATLARERENIDDKRRRLSPPSRLFSKYIGMARSLLFSSSLPFLFLPTFLRNAQFLRPNVPEKEIHVAETGKADAASQFFGMARREYEDCD